MPEPVQLKNALASDRLVRGLDAPLGSELLDIPVAAREPEIEIEMP